jgi:type IV secretion system protein VirB9
MRKINVPRSLVALAAGLALTAGGAGLMTRAAVAAAVVMPDGTMRYDYGRRPQAALVCKPETVCDIALGSNETVLNMAIGDASRWIIASGRSGPGGTTPHLFVKPTQANLETNIVITTTKRVYNVDLRSAKEAPHPSISFFYPDEDAAAKALAGDQQRLAIQAVLAGTPLVGADRADTKYKVTGDAALLPDKVFNDGVRTYITWKSLPVQLPTVVSVPTTGAAQPVNFRVVGTSYIVDDIDPNLDLVIAADPDRHGHPERRVVIRHQ